MPELPEVETIKRDLKKVLTGRELVQVKIQYPGSVKFPDAEELSLLLPGHKITGVGRRGKYLQIFLDDGTVVVVHLRMTGKLIFAEKIQKPDKHTHVIFRFAGGACLMFHDIRKFGTIYWLPPDRFCEIKGLYTLGPEPASPAFNERYLAQKAKNRKGSIKAMLLNQQIVAGLGNIYADESLHRAGIRPDRQACSLDDDEWAALYRSVCTVLNEAIHKRGTTMSDYRDASGSYGRFQDHLRVYKRNGLPCTKCGRLIERSVVAGRGTHFCPECQK